MRIWSDREVRRLSRPQPNGQSLWVYLLTGRETVVIPGAFAAREAGLAEELRWPLEGFRKAFAEVNGEAFLAGLPGAEKPLAKADWEAGFVWVPNAIKHNPPQSLNVIKSWQQTWDELPECDLKEEAYQGLRSYIERGMGKAFGQAFAEAIPTPSWKPSAKPSPKPSGMPSAKACAIQEQDQEQDPNGGGGGDLLARAKLNGSGPEPAAAAPKLRSEDVATAWNREAGKLTVAGHAHAHWEVEFSSIAAACNAEAERDSFSARVVLEALLGYFWRAPAGAVQSGRVPAHKADPGQLAKRISRDLHEASAWYAQQQRLSRETGAAAQ